MRQVLIIGLVTLTSVAGYVYGKAVLRLPGARAAASLRTMLECMWLGLVFFVLNSFVTFGVVLLARAGTGGFLSLYVVTDVTFVVLSFLQGLLFHLWRCQRKP